VKQKIFSEKYLVFFVHILKVNEVQKW